MKRIQFITLFSILLVLNIQNVYGVPDYFSNDQLKELAQYWNAERSTKTDAVKMNVIDYQYYCETYETNCIVDIEEFVYLRLIDDETCDTISRITNMSELLFDDPELNYATVTKNEIIWFHTTNSTEFDFSSMITEVASYEQYYNSTTNECNVGSPTQEQIDRCREWRAMMHDSARYFGCLYNFCNGVRVTMCQIKSGFDVTSTSDTYEKIGTGEQKCDNCPKIFRYCDGIPMTYYETSCSGTYTEEHQCNADGMCTKMRQSYVNSKQQDNDIECFVQHQQNANPDFVTLQPGKYLRMCSVYDCYDTNYSWCQINSMSCSLDYYKNACPYTCSVCKVDTSGLGSSIPGYVNTVRINTDSQLSNLTYDSNLANYAIKVSSHCDLALDFYDYSKLTNTTEIPSGYQEIKIAIAAATSYDAFTSIIPNVWGVEDYNYSTQTCTSGTCDNIISLLDSSVTKLGCGYSRCGTVAHNVCAFGVPT